MTYSSRWADDGRRIYSHRPIGNLGELPESAHPGPHGNCGTYDRTDGGDPYEHARFVTGSGREIVIEADRD